MSKRLNAMWLRQYREAVEVDPTFRDMGQDAYEKMRQVWFAGAAGALNSLMETANTHWNFRDSTIISDSVLLEMRDECADVCKEAADKAERKATEEREEIASRLDALKERLERIKSLYASPDLFSPTAPAPGQSAPGCTPGAESPTFSFNGKTYRKADLSLDNPAVAESVERAIRVIPIGGVRTFAYWGPIREPVNVKRTGETSIQIEPYVDDTDDDDEEPDDDDNSDPDDESPGLTPEQDAALKKALDDLLANISRAVGVDGPAQSNGGFFRFK